MNDVTLEDMYEMMLNLMKPKLEELAQSESPPSPFDPLFTTLMGYPVIWESDPPHIVQGDSTEETK